MDYKYDEKLGVCQYCGAKKVRNPKTGKIFCADKCWLKGKEVGVGGENASQVNFSAQGAFPTRSEEIREAQKHKEDSMRIMSAGRDATMIVQALIQQGATWTEEQIKEEIEKWNKYFFEKIYGDAPFK